jgi:hypothetical protein
MIVVASEKREYLLFDFDFAFSDGTKVIQHDILLISCLMLSISTFIKFMRS